MARPARVTPTKTARAARPPRAVAPSRIEGARRRATVAKAGVAGVALLCFGGAMAFARLSFAGHPKRALRPLAAPPRFTRIVRENLLQAGVVAPAQAPPGAATATS